MRAADPAVAVTLVLLVAHGVSWYTPISSAEAAQIFAQVDQPVVPLDKTPPEEGKAPPSVTVIDATEARGILGRDVRTNAGENMGRIVDVIVDRAGQVRACVIDFGGFLGVGSRKIVVDWNALHFARVANKGDSITLELTREQVKAAPEYKEGNPIVVLGVTGSLEPLRFVTPIIPEK